MKKRFILSYFLLTLFFFASFLFMKKEKDKSNVYNLFDFYQEQKVNSIILKEENKPSELSDLLGYLEAYGKSGDTKFIVNNYSFDGEGKVKKIVYYIAADDQYIKREILTFFSKDYDLDKTYISSVKGEGGQYLHLFTNEIDIEIHKFKDILKDNKLISSIHYFPINDEEKENIEGELMTKYFEYVESFGVSDSEFYDMDKNLIRTMTYYSLVCLLLFALVNIFIISKKLRNLSIYKINGYKTKDIIFELFKENIKIVLISSLLLPILYYLVFINQYDNRSIAFLLDFYKYILIFNGLYFISLLLAYSIVRKMSISMLVKSYNLNHFILKNTILIGLVLALPLSTILNPGLKDLVNDKGINLIKLIKMNEAYKDIVISNGFKSESRRLSFNQEDEIAKKENKNNDKHKELYKRLESDKSIYKYQENVLLASNNEEYYVTDVNKKLLDDLNLRKSHKKISIDYEDNSLYVFFNKNDFNKELWDNYKDDYYEKVVFITYDEISDLGLDIFQYESNLFPIIAYSTRDNYPIYQTIENNTIFQNTNKGKIERVLSEYGWEGKIILNEGREVVKRAFGEYFKGLASLMFNLIPGILISLYIIATVGKFYFESFKKKWAVFYINGWKKRDVIKSFALISIAFILAINLLQLLIYREVKIYYNIFLSIVLIYNNLLLLRKYSKIDAATILQARED